MKPGKVFEFFQGPNGEYSSKRLFALASFVVAIALAVQGKPAEVVAIFNGSAVAVFLASALGKS
jgi:hypothetical protein